MLLYCYTLTTNVHCQLDLNLILKHLITLMYLSPVTQKDANSCVIWAVPTYYATSVLACENLQGWKRVSSLRQEKTWLLWRETTRKWEWILLVPLRANRMTNTDILYPINCQIPLECCCISSHIIVKSRMLFTFEEYSVSLWLILFNSYCSLHSVREWL